MHFLKKIKCVVIFINNKMFRLHSNDTQQSTIKSISNWLCTYWSASCIRVRLGISTRLDVVHFDASAILSHQQNDFYHCFDTMTQSCEFVFISNSVPFCCVKIISDDNESAHPTPMHYFIIRNIVEERALWIQALSTLTLFVVGFFFNLSKWQKNSKNHLLPVASFITPIDK